VERLSRGSQHARRWGWLSTACLGTLAGIVSPQARFTPLRTDPGAAPTQEGMRYKGLSEQSASTPDRQH